MAGTALPLFTWQQDAAAARLAVERRELRERIARLPPMSHRRVELSARLRQLTNEELRLELEDGTAR